MTTTPSQRRSLDVRVGPEPASVTPSRRLPGWVRVLLAVLMMYAFAFAPGLAFVIPGLGNYLESQAHDAVVVPAMWAIYSLSLLTAIAVVWLAMKYVDRRPFRDTGWVWNGRSLPALGLGIAVTVAIAVPVALAVQATGTLRPSPVPGAGFPMWSNVLIGLAMAFMLQGIPEEIVWRGYVMQTLQTSPITAVYISATVFAVCHLGSSGGQESAWERVVYLFIPFGFSLLAGALLLYTGSLWAAIGVHGGFHVANMINVLGFGVGNGPVLWAAEGAVLTVVGAILLRRWSATAAASGTS